MERDANITWKFLEEENCHLMRMLHIVIDLYSGCYFESVARDVALFPLVPEFFQFPDDILSRLLSVIHCSSLMHRITSIELDENCVFPSHVKQEGLWFPESPHLTHLRMAFKRLDGCIRLLHQFGEQLHSLAITVRDVLRSETYDISDITSASSFS